MPLPYEKIMYRAAACSYSFNIIKALIQSAKLEFTLLTVGDGFPVPRAAQRRPYNIFLVYTKINNHLVVCFLCYNILWW